MSRSLLLLAVAALPLGAQLPAVRPLGPIAARSAEKLGAVATAVPLPDGRVLVNDILGRRVVVFDSTLASFTVVADTTSATGNAYGARGGGLIGYGADSALFIDPASLTMMVVNGKGELTTVRAVPRANEIGFLAGGPSGRPGFTPDGRLVYRGQARNVQARREARPAVGNFVLPEQPDSAPIVRVELATRKVDTVGTFKIPKVDMRVSQGNDGRVRLESTVNPMPTTDDWALLSDGTVAIVRGHDFHVDWVSPTGEVTSSPKLAYDWQRLSDEDKQLVLDSARTEIEKRRAEGQRLLATGGPQALMNQGGGERVMIFGGGPGGPGGGPPLRNQAPAAAPATPAPAGGASANGAPAGAGPAGATTAAPTTGFQLPPINLVPASQLPDYRPPFTQGSSLGDLDGTLWVRTTSPVGTQGPIYYVINTKGEIVDRVQMPQGRVVAGFGKGGVVYLGVRDAEGGARLEWARWK